MIARIIVEQPGLGVTAQDFGRTRYRALGVPLSGALDPVQLAAANALAGAPEGSAGLEILLAAPVFASEQGPLRVGLAGALSGMLTRADGSEHSVAGWRGLVLQTGDSLALRLTRGPAYLGFSGGLDLPLVLGSRSTFLRGKFGGIDGRALVAGDLLRCAAAEGEELAAPVFAHEDGPLRFIPGPQDQNFTPEARAAFAATAWRVSADSDRMGMRLAGPKLTHRPAARISCPTARRPARSRFPVTASPLFCERIARLLEATPRSAASSRRMLFARRILRLGIASHSPPSITKRRRKRDKNFMQNLHNGVKKLQLSDSLGI